MCICFRCSSVLSSRAMQGCTMPLKYITMKYYGELSDGFCSPNLVRHSAETTKIPPGLKATLYPFAKAKNCSCSDKDEQRLTWRLFSSAIFTLHLSFS